MITTLTNHKFGRKKGEKNLCEKDSKLYENIPHPKVYLAYHDVHLGSLQWKRPMGERHPMMQDQTKVSLPQE
jgi:hypothetical protein